MLKDTLEQGQHLIDQALEKLLPSAQQRPESIHQAMRHSVFAGGKRLRPILCMEAARMVAGKLPAGIEKLGSALEMLHTYSLIHDDLPALDNDDLRRGKPTCHVVFGEALAILAGDALQYIHSSKTGALITASLVSGGIYVGGTHAEIQRLRDFGRAIGLAFQIVDDVLDVTQSSIQLGKTAGKDTASEKATYPALFGIEESERKAEALVTSGCNSLESFGQRAQTLKELARFLVQRKK